MFHIIIVSDVYATRYVTSLPTLMILPLLTYAWPTSLLFHGLYQSFSLCDRCTRNSATNVCTCTFAKANCYVFLPQQPRDAMNKCRKFQILSIFLVENSMYSQDRSSNKFFIFIGPPRPFERCSNIDSLTKKLHEYFCSWQSEEKSMRV